MSLVISFMTVFAGFLLPPSLAQGFSARAEERKEGRATCHICQIACCLQHWNRMVVADVEAHMVLIISSFTDNKAAVSDELNRSPDTIGTDRV